MADINSIGREEKAEVIRKMVILGKFREVWNLTKRSVPGKCPRKRNEIYDFDLLILVAKLVLAGKIVDSQTLCRQCDVICSVSSA